MNIARCSTNFMLSVLRFSPQVACYISTGMLTRTENSRTRTRTNIPAYRSFV